MKKATLILCLFWTFSMKAQILTKEDSLQAGLNVKNSNTVLSGYGEAKVDHNLSKGTSTANITRMVMFFGHRFDKDFLFFSELELEDAAVGEGKFGSLALEQMVIKANLNRDAYLLAGLFIPRIGITNENHLPTTFNSNDRPAVERMVLPSTWREVGIGYYQRSMRIPGLNYSLGLMNGLDASGFTHGSGIRKGRQQGSDAMSRNLAITGALLHYYRNFRIQTSIYFGGSNGLAKHVSDSLLLPSGVFGAPVLINEINVSYFGRKFYFKTLAARTQISKAFEINRAYANNTPSTMVGAYAEIGLKLWEKESKNLWVYDRFEYINLNSSIPSNGINDEYMNQMFNTFGIVLKPIPGIAFKLDYFYRKTGVYNPVLYTVNPFDPQMAFSQNTSILNLGLAYSF